MMAITHTPKTNENMTTAPSNAFSRILITGGMGFFGWNAALHLHKRGITTISTSSAPQSYPASAQQQPAQLNVLDKASIEACFADYLPDAVIHAAAFSAPLACEKDPDTAYSINVLGTQNVAAVAVAHQIPMVYLSTDLVFNGEKNVLEDGFYTESDALNATIIYGKTKIEAERFLQEQSFGKWIILRSALMFGRGVAWANGFPQFALDALKSGKQPTLFTDQFRTPAYIPDIVDAILLLLETKNYGNIYHCGGAERIDRVSFVQRYAAVSGLDTSGIVACTMDDIPAYTTRVRDVSLSTAKLQAALAPKWQALHLEAAFGQMLRDES